MTWWQFYFRLVVHLWVVNSLAVHLLPILCIIPIGIKRTRPVYDSDRKTFTYILDSPSTFISFLAKKLGVNVSADSQCTKPALQPRATFRKLVSKLVLQLDRVLKITQVMKTHPELSQKALMVKHEHASSPYQDA